MRKFLASFLEVLEIAVVAVVAVFIVRTFLVQPFLVSGSSMSPNFSNGDYVLVDELTYHLRAPERGEVAVFHDPQDYSTYFIKRVIGLPNERVTIKNDVITVFNSAHPHGFALDESYLPQGTYTSGDYDVTLSSSTYLMLGDNRPFSYDSRMWGTLPKSNIVGLVRVRLWPLNEMTAFAAPQYSNNDIDKPKENQRTFQAVKGMHDVLPADQPYWDRIEGVAKDLARAYGFGRIETPVLEFADLYNKTSGEESEVVQKEMYTLHTKGGDFLALRPEYTPGVARAYLENGLSRLGQPQKLFQFGPIFRHERPQLGRARQFTQIGFETLAGPNDPIYDAEIISIFSDLLAELKIKNTLLKINSIGCRVCRPLYKKQLVNYYKNHESELCEDCAQRLKTNPLRLLDCKEEECMKLKEKAPNFLDKLCVCAREHFKSVLEYLEEVAIPYELDNHLVRGLDYYSRTVFEIYADGNERSLARCPLAGATII